MSNDTDPQKTILIVEDEPVIRLNTAEFLEEIGHHVLQATDAGDAMEILEKLGPAVDVLFTDIKMPGEIDGLELATLAHARWPHLALLVTSGHVRLSPRDLPDHGRFLLKPYDFNAVKGLLKD